MRCPSGGCESRAMSKPSPSQQPHIEYHKSGTVCARGQKLDGALHGYWEWFRADGTRLRSGSFDRGEQVGEWTTYDRKGNVYKVTAMKPKPAKADVTAPPAKPRRS